MSIIIVVIDSQKLNEKQFDWHRMANKNSDSQQFIAECSAIPAKQKKNWNVRFAAAELA